MNLQRHCPIVEFIFKKLAVKDYFYLQYKMLNRQMNELGIHPVLAYPLGVILFLLASLFLFVKVGFAAYIYPFLAISFIAHLSESNRSDFLKTCFSKKQYSEIRLLENGIVVLPFVLFLIYKGEYWIGIALLGVALLLALANFMQRSISVIPTPFGKQPFEFIVGFRLSFLAIGFAYFLTVISIYVGNFNLGVFALLIVLLVSSSFYGKPEIPYFVWIFSSQPKQFLFQKMKTALWYSTILTIPILIGLGIAFSKYIHFLVIFQVFGYLFLLTILLGKYSVFPKEMNLPEALIIAMCTMIPPLLIFPIMYFYQKAKSRLQEIL